MEIQNKEIYIDRICPICRNSSNFLNVGEDEEEWICGSCKNKTDFGRGKLAIRRTGYYWIKDRRKVR